VPPAFPTGSCPLWLSPSGESMTQESLFELLLTVSRMQHRVPRRTVSLHPAQASQRPCEGSVSHHTTRWLHDTTEKSMPSQEREHQWNEPVLPTSPRESRFSLAYSHPDERHPMTWRQSCRSKPLCTRNTNLTNWPGSLRTGVRRGPTPPSHRHLQHPLYRLLPGSRAETP
jgi:hypothetical protein